MDRLIHRGVSIVRRGRRWRWQIRQNGRAIVGSAATLEEAVAGLDAALNERARERVSSLQGEARFVGVGDLCKQWLTQKCGRLAPATAAQYGIHIRCHIVPGIGDCNANLIKPRDLEALYAGLRWKSAKESHNILRQAFSWGLLNGELIRESNPALVCRPDRRSCVDHDGFFGADDGGIKPVSEKSIPTPLEIEKLLIDAQQREMWPWWLYLKVGATTGARPGEVCALRRRDLDFDAWTIRIEWSADRVAGWLKRPKTPSSIRALKIGGLFFEEVRELLPNEPGAFLFPSNTNPGSVSPLPCWNSRSVKRRLDAALERLGLPHYTPHSLRHYVATHLLDQGWPALQVGRFLGHADDSLVRRLYGNHIVDDTQRRIGEAAALLT